MRVSEFTSVDMLRSNNAVGEDLADEADAQPISFASFFGDMPWLNIPKYRQTIFVEPPRHRGGLLGGASTPGKMSKLQALAAARKKKADNQKSEEKLHRVTQHLSNLSTAPGQPESVKENVRPPLLSTGEAVDLIAAGDPIIPQRATFAQVNVGNEDLQDQSDAAGKRPVEPQPAAASPPLPIATPPETATPSPFAQALLRPTNSSAAPSPRTYPFPYMNVASSSTDAFSAPSPDDVVLKAQSQGSLMARKVAK